MSRSSVRWTRLSRRFSNTQALVPVRTSSMSSIMIASNLVVRDHSSQKPGREGRDSIATYVIYRPCMDDYLDSGVRSM
jgi:hypothetical protein